MKKALFALAAVGMAASAFADATLVFGNRTIDNAAGTGTYNVPIWKSNGDTDSTTVNPTSGNGAGTLAGGVTVGLFTTGGVAIRNDTGGLAQSLLRTDANAQFFATSSQVAVVPGATPGQSATVVVRAWQGSSFANASTTPGQNSAQWTVTTKPLGGPDPGGGPPKTPPTMTGWGPESGAGLDLITTVPEPTTIALGAIGVGALLLRRRK